MANDEISHYEVLITLTAGIHVQHHSNLDAVAQNLSGGTPAIKQQWVDRYYGKARVAPGLQYYHGKFSGELSETVAAFKAARLVLPQKMVEMQPNSQDVDALQAFFLF